MMILGGVHTPFIVSASIDTPSGEAVLTEEFDTYAEAVVALEDFILSHEDEAHDYVMVFKKSDLRVGDIVKFDFVTVSDRAGRAVKKTKRKAVGAWAICWMKPSAPPPDPADDAARADLRAAIVASGVRRI